MPSSPSHMSQLGTVPVAAVAEGGVGITPLKGGGAGGWGGLEGGACAGGEQAKASGHTLGSGAPAGTRDFHLRRSSHEQPNISQQHKPGLCYHPDVHCISHQSTSKHRHEPDDSPIQDLC
jgi:hypothetical protein